MFLGLFVLIPIAAAFILLLTRPKTFNLTAVISGILLIMACWGLKGVFTGGTLVYTLSLPGPFSPVFRADPLSAIMVILASFLWFVISIYAPRYMEVEGRAEVFQFITLATLGPVLGIFLAGDLITMLLFFELMTITSYFWVIHRMNKEAIRAGYFYLFFSIIGGLFIALAIVFLGAGSNLPLDMGRALSALNDSALYIWGIALLIAGFGIKAGMAPLHLWLPHAHSAAPTPGSALLSGLLIKVGAYGLIRTGEFLGWGLELKTVGAGIGPGLALLGIATMLTGVLAALLQSDAKKLLAYHSVSQMGYIILGLGLGLYLGPQGSLGLVGSIYHIVNHALFKAALFLGVGVIYLHTGETNLYNLGGLRRRFPLTATLMFIAVLGITGTPGLNGYASKTLLHHAMSQAAATSVPWAVWAERLFLVVGVGTTASFAKLYYLMFLGKPSGKIRIKGESSFTSPLAMGLLSAVMIVIGLMPGLFPKLMAAPAAQVLGIKNAGSSLADLSFWTFADIKGMIITLALGILTCWAGLKSGAFHWHPPVWLTLEGLGGLVYRGITALWNQGKRLNRSIAEGLPNLGRSLIANSQTAFQKTFASRKSSFCGIILYGVSLKAAILILTLLILIVSYTFANPGF